MGNVALYTFGLLDPAAGPSELADFSRRGIEIFGASDHAPGFLGRADSGSAYVPGEDFGPWGVYVLPSGLPGFEGRDPNVHIATLSLWQDVESARRFVYRGLHRDALRLRRDWFLAGPWPGHVLWPVAEDVVPRWTDGVERLQALARDGVSEDRFTFGSERRRP